MRLRARKAPTVVVIGGGMSGLAAAHRLVTMPQRTNVVLLESADRVGGCVRRAEIAGVQFDSGPESLLARVPWGRELITELGLDDQVTEMAQLGAHVWVRGAMRPLPPGLMTATASVSAVRRSGLLTARGQARAALDLVLPARPVAGDESIADAIGARFGHEAVEAIAEPLLGGIYAGDVSRLSTRAAMPAIAAARARGGSLLRGLRSNPAPAQDGPVFVSLRGGLSRLPGLIADEIGRLGGDVRLRTHVRGIAKVENGLRLDVGGRKHLHADAVVLAVPATQAARLLEPHAPVAARHAAAIRHAPVAITTFAFPAGTVVPQSTGFLVAGSAESTISACTLSSNKWPESLPGPHVMLRCSAGRVGAPPPADDDELVALARGDLERMIGVNADPVAWRVARYEDALPQHDVGHLDRLAKIENDVAQSLPRVSLAGAWTRAIGISACIRDGRSAAENAMIAAQSAAPGA